MPTRCRTAHLLTTDHDVHVLRCVLDDRHQRAHEADDGITWHDGVQLRFHRLGDGYAVHTRDRAFAVYSDFWRSPARRRDMFTWDLDVRDLTAAPGIRHRAGAPTIHHGRYCRRFEAYDVALAYATLGEGFPEAERWHTAHRVAGVPVLDVPTELPPHSHGPDPWSVRETENVTAG